MKDINKNGVPHGQTVRLSAHGVDVDVLAGSYKGSAHTLLDYRGPPRFSAVHPHRHTSCTEWFHVLSGRIECNIDNETKVLAAGEYIEVPPGAMHCWRNPADQDFRVLIGFNDPEMDGYFFELFSLLNDPDASPPIDGRKMINLGARYKTEMQMQERVI